MTTGVITTSFPRHAGDFAGCFVEDAVRAQASAGETVEVIAAGPAPDHAGPRPERPDLLPAIRVLRVGAASSVPATSLFYGAGAPETLEAGGLGVWVQAGLFWAGLCERIRARAPMWDRIVAHWLVPSALAASAIAPDLPLACYAHSGDVALLERLPGGAALARRLAKDVDDLIFVSTDLHQRFARLTGRATGRVAPPPVSAHPRVTSVRKPLHRNSAVGVPGRTVLSVGRLVPIKGFDILLRAVRIAAAEQRVRGADFMTVVILGDGPERDRLQSLARRLDLDVRLPGSVPRPEVTRWMHTADCYIQPSRRLPTGRTEGLPTATLEALQAGLPVVASRTGGLADIEGPGVRLVAPDNVRALASALRELS